MPNATGEIIKSLRKEKGLTQEQLGKLIGVQKSAIAKYERGEIVNLKRETIEKLATIFDVRPSFIMGMTDSSVELSEHEYRVINAYRKSDDPTKTAIDLILKIK